MTVENVCEAVQGVEWTVLGYHFLTIGKYQEMEQLQDTSNENRLREVVKYWFDSSQKPSWRRLIWILDDSDQTRVADKIRHFAEPIVGKS